MLLNTDNGYAPMSLETRCDCCQQQAKNRISSDSYILRCLRRIFEPVFSVEDRVKAPLGFDAKIQTVCLVYLPGIKSFG